MSYARFGSDSDVYVFESVGGWLECCGCALREDWRGPVVKFNQTAGMIEHLREHVVAHHDVPPETFAQLRAEAETLDREMAEERAAPPRQASLAPADADGVSNSDALEVECPACGAPAGKWCHNAASLALTGICWYRKAAVAPRASDGPMQFHDPT